MFDSTSLFVPIPTIFLMMRQASCTLRSLHDSNFVSLQSHRLKSPQELLRWVLYRFGCNKYHLPAAGTSQVRRYLQNGGQVRSEIQAGDSTGKKYSL